MVGGFHPSCRPDPGHCTLRSCGSYSGVYGFVVTRKTHLNQSAGRYIVPKNQRQIQQPAVTRGCVPLNCWYQKLIESSTTEGIFPSFNVCDFGEGGLLRSPSLSAWLQYGPVEFLPSQTCTCSAMSAYASERGGWYRRRRAFSIQYVTPTPPLNGKKTILHASSFNGNNRYGHSERQTSSFHGRECR